jgi:hypothetical protein
MKYIYLLTLVQFFIGSSCQPQKAIDTNQMSIKAKAQAIKMGSSLINGDVDAYVGFHYPKMIQMMGGKQQTITTIKNSWRKNEEDSIKIISYSIGIPSKIIFYKEQYQCTFPYQMITAVKNQKVSFESTLVAVSMDKGEKWYFLDAANDMFEKIKTYFPEISDELEVPKQTEAKILN